MVPTISLAAAAKTRTSATGTDRLRSRTRHDWAVGSRGFTLVELLVVLALLGVLSAVVLVSGPGLLEAQQQRAVFRSVLVDVKQARQTAIRNGVAVEYLIDAKARWLGPVDGRRIDLPDGVFLRVEVAGETLDDRLAVIRFEPDGSATGGSIELYLSSGEGFRLVVDWLTGRTTGHRIQWSP